MNNQRGVIHLLPLLLVVLAIAVVALIITGYVKLPKISSPFQKKVSVELKKTYDNPFNKETQFVNPFQTYKNPFVVNR